MVFGEKIYKLRKERALSQEALAEQLGTTRQAISKWENNQGFPETEKLLMLANVFSVSIDYLLMDNESSVKSESDGYYVSREKAEAWILHERQMIRKFGTGVAFLICAGIPFLLFEEFYIIRILCVITFILIGIVTIFKLCLADTEYEFKALKQNPLLFDRNYFEELKIKYEALRKKYLNMMVSLPVVLVLGASIILVEKYYKISVGEFVLPIFLLLIALSIFMFLYGSTMKEAYELLVNNSEYTNKWTTRFMKKLRKLTEDKPNNKVE